MPVCPVLPLGKSQRPLDRFNEIWFFNIYRKSAEKYQVSLKSGYKEKDTLHEHRYTFLSSRSFLLRMRNISDIICREKETHIFFSNIFFRKSCGFLRKYGKLF